MPITRQFPADIFTLIPMSELTATQFEKHPIWSEYYDFDEREEIIDWGVDRDWLTLELERMARLLGNEHCAYSILRPYPLPHRMRLYIKARLTTAEGVLLDGYVMNDDAWVLAVFVEDAKFTFSRHSDLADLDDTELLRLRAAMGDPTAEVFPIQYETDFLDHSDTVIAGTFVPSSDT